MTQVPPPPAEPNLPARDDPPDPLMVQPVVVEESEDTRDPLMVRPVTVEASEDDAFPEPPP
ncbi:hypothetical protein HUW63_17745, partial [Myxococcus sp. AM001]|nr:hypothetical protein [Myxococcus sp. AM001]